MINEIQKIVKEGGEITIEDKQNNTTISLYINFSTLEIDINLRYPQYVWNEEITGKTNPFALCYCEEHQGYIPIEELHHQNSILIFPTYIQKEQNRYNLEIILNLRNNKILIKSFSPYIPSIIINDFPSKIKKKVIWENIKKGGDTL